VLWTSMAAWAVWMLQNWAPWLPGSGQQWHWAHVPSVRSGRVGEHPLRTIVKAVLPEVLEAPLHVNNPSDERDFDPTRFACDGALTGPVLLVDDSWVTGGNAFSAASALKLAGATRVDAVVFGRLLNPAWGPAKTFIEQNGLGSGFNPAISPWIPLI